MRLDKALASQGFGSRKACRGLIDAGSVQVNGAAVSDPELEVDPVGLVLTVDGVDWRYRERLVLALHKPTGFECSHAPTHHPSVFTLVPRPYVARGVQCVGRLDADTSGLLILTDDGALLQRLTSPKRHVPKVYVVECASEVTDAQLERLRQGVVLADDPSPARARLVDRHGARGLRLTIDEGRYHQVRRMLAAVGNHVDALMRVQVGSFGLPASLAPSAFVELDDSAIGLLERAEPAPSGV